MLLGLEHQLGLHRAAAAEQPPLCPSSEPATEEITDFDDSFDAALSAPPTLLMSLLSGKQKARKKQKREAPLPTLAEDTDPDVSFDASEFQRHVAAQNSLAELESKMYNSVKSISAKSLLQRPRDAKVDVAEVVDAVAVPDEPLDAIELLEATHAKRVTAKDLFASFGPKKTKPKALEVTLKVSPARLAELKPSKNVVSTLLGRKPTRKITLKLPPAFLREVEKTLNPLYTRSSGVLTGKSAKSVFAMLMQTATSNANPKLTPIQKLKGLDPPPLSRELMHVYDSNPPPPALLSQLQAMGRRERTPSASINDTMATLIPDTQTDVFGFLRNSLYSYKQISLSDLESYVSLHAPLAFTKAAHKRIYQEFVLRPTSPDLLQLNWPQRFQPSDLDTALIDEDASYLIKKWFENAFAILKSQSTKTPRNVKIREQQLKQKRREAALNSFIVDDDEEDFDNETEEDIFVPILIIQGDNGSCKSASVYAAMKALDGYVHEINTGQQRSRKDLYASLREFCTSQIIQQKKGVVLFEDCDILFEQDKTFWSVVQDVLNFSRRPIVVTASDLNVIPKNIWELAEEHNAIIRLSGVGKNSLKQYLWLCSLSQRCSPSQGLLDNIIKSCKSPSGHDLRKALMATQWVCYKKNNSQESITEIQLHEPPATSCECNELSQVADRIEALSVSDVVAENSTSAILHQIQPNELLDVYHIDPSLHLTQPTLPHELNIGEYIGEQQCGDFALAYSGRTVTFNELRESVVEFIYSRAKKIPKFLQELNFRVQTRSRSSTELFEEPPDTQGLPDTSVFYSTPRTAFVTNLAPMARYWARFQVTIASMDQQRQAQTEGPSIESFIGWRRFHHHVNEVIETFAP